VSGFVDEATIEVSSGAGGDGAVSFRREKYIPRGGPDGGDGGKGGSVVFIVKNNVKTLSQLRQKHFFKAEDGKSGRGKRMTGRDGKNTEIFVPPGTIIKDTDTKEILKDFSRSEEWVYLEGGRGGKGNWHFRSSTRRAPRIATPGKSGKHRILLCELKLIADIGLVGLPNAGKSTLLSVLTNANPKIADYPFTTLIPNLGVLFHKGGEIVIADIPGIIEDASSGAGLGTAFLKHIARTRLLVFLVDAERGACVEDLRILLKEIRTFSAELSSRKKLVVVSKADCGDGEACLESLAQSDPGLDLHCVSSATGMGIAKLKDLMLAMTESVE
jgi:GTP-binding protein